MREGKQSGRKKADSERERDVEPAVESGWYLRLVGVGGGGWLYGPMELCLYFNEGAMLIPLAARSRFSPLRERRKTRFSISRQPQTAHGVEPSLSRVKRSRAVRDRRINSHFTRVFANFKGNRSGGGGRSLQRPIVLISFACLLARLLLEGVPVQLGNRKHKRGAIFPFSFLLRLGLLLFFSSLSSSVLAFFNVARQLEYFRAFENVLLDRSRVNGPVKAFYLRTADS